MNLSSQFSDITKSADSFPDVVLSLNNSESSNNYLSTAVLVLLIVALCGGKLLHAKYK